MIGLDSNIILRLLTDDNPKQVAVARALLTDAADAAGSFYINHVVLAECAWALRSIYGFSRPAIAAGLGSLMDVVAFEIEDRDVVSTALAEYEQGPADFPDYLVAVKNRQAGCAYTVSFDKRALRIDGVMPVSPLR